MNGLLKKTLALVTLLSACGAALAIKHDNVGELKIDRKDGSAPLTVAIEAPAELVDCLSRWQKNNGQHQKWGDGFSVNWGDGLAAGDAARGHGSPGSEMLAQSASTPMQSPALIRCPLTCMTLCRTTATKFTGADLPPSQLSKSY